MYFGENEIDFSDTMIFTTIFQQLKRYLDDEQTKFGFEEGKDFVMASIVSLMDRNGLTQTEIKNILKKEGKIINLVKESETECGIACVYEFNGKKYLVRGENDTTDIIVPVGEVSDSDLAEILEQGYEGRDKKDRDRLNENNKNILDSAVLGDSLKGAYSRRNTRRGQVQDASKSVRETNRNRENPEIDKGGQEYDE